MSGMIQIRNISKDLHSLHKARAVIEGKSLSYLLLAGMRVIASRPSVADLRARLARLQSAELSVESTEVLRIVAARLARTEVP